MSYEQAMKHWRNHRKDCFHQQCGWVPLRPVIENPKCEWCQTRTPKGDLDEKGRCPSCSEVAAKQAKP